MDFLNPKIQQFYLLAYQYDENELREVDGQMASTLEPIELCKVSYRDLCAKFNIN